MGRQIKYILFIILLGVCGASPAMAASVTLTSSSADAPFIVQGNDMNGVAGMKLTVGYDPSVLASPTVTWGSLVSGALSLANTTVAGKITIAIIKNEPLTGSGPIASISFATRKAGGGIPTVFVEQMVDNNGTDLLAPTGTAAVDPGFSKTAGVPFSQPETPVASTRASSSTATSATSTSAATASTSQGVVSGTIGMPSDKQQPKSETPPAEPKTTPAVEHVEPTEPVTHELRQSPAEATTEASEPAVVKQTVYSGILERFQTYQGVKSPENLLALFKKPVSASIRQEPAVAISDGKRSVRVTVDISALNGASSNFALSEASLVSLKRDEVAGTWTLEVLPRLNSLKASVTILSNRAIIEFPLTVVPPVAAISVKEADFAAFLKDSGATVPKQDLNGDGRHDYLDDFIYTAHYLLNGAAAEPKKK